MKKAKIISNWVIHGEQQFGKIAYFDTDWLDEIKIKWVEVKEKPPKKEKDNDSKI